MGMRTGRLSDWSARKQTNTRTHKQTYTHAQSLSEAGLVSCVQTHGRERMREIYDAIICNLKESLGTVY